MPRTGGVRAYARHRRCSASVVSRAVVDGRLPTAARRDGRGRVVIDFKAADREWRETRDPSKVRDAAPGRARSGVTLADTRQRVLAAQAIKLERENRVRAGELITVAEVERVWLELFGVVKSRMLALPAALAERLTHVAQAEGPRAVFALLTEHVRDALHECAVWRPAGAAPERTTPPGALSAERRSQP